MKAYHDILRKILEFGEEKSDRTGVGTISLFGDVQFRHDMSEGFPLLTTKKLTFRWIAEELFWFLSGSTNEQDLRDKGVDIWKEWATAEQCAKFGRKAGDLGPIYGKLWRNFFGDGSTSGDQIRQLCETIRNSPDSRRQIVSGWHPKEQGNVSLPPCHTLWQTYVHTDGRFSLKMYQRSADVFLGVPYNIASYALLLCILAEAFSYKPGFLYITFGDIHIYRNHIGQVNEQLMREPYELPKLEVSLPARGLDGVLQCRYSHLKLTGYRSHPKIYAPVAI